MANPFDPGSPQKKPATKPQTSGPSTYKAPSTHTSSGGTSSGSSGGGSSGGKTAAQIEAERKRIAAYKRQLTSWVYGKTNTDLGFRNLTADQKKAVNRLIANEAKQTSPNKSTLLNALIKKTPKAYLKSASVGNRLTEVQNYLAQTLGVDVSRITSDKQLLSLVKQYALNPNRDISTVEKAVQQTPEFKERYKYLADFTAEPTAQSLTQKTAAYLDYQRAFQETMGDEYSPEEETIFFKSGVSKQNFLQNYNLYMTNRDAWAKVMGYEMPNQKRQAAIFNAEQGYEQANTGPQVGRLEREALSRASEVGEVIGRNNPSYQWSTGQALSQEQRQNMLYQQGSYQADRQKLANAFNLQRSYFGGKESEFGTQKIGGVIVQEGI